MFKRLGKWKVFFLLLIFVCVFSFLYSYRSHQEKNQVCTDIEFVQQQFPNIEDIKGVRYYYWNKSNEREIGLQNIEFCGFIKVGDKFYEKIVRDYNQKETKKARKVVPKSRLMKGDNKEYHFSYSYDFSFDGKYKSNSWGGDFYLDKTYKVLYFELEW